MVTEQWIPNCGAPLDPEKVKAGFTWDPEISLWVRPEEQGGETYWAPDGWWTLFGLPYHEGRGVLDDFQYQFETKEL